MKIITPLNDQEITRLEHLLKQENAIDVSTLDGLFTALISGPELASPEEWLPVVFQKERWTGSDLDEFEELFKLLVRHMNGIESILSRAPESFEPIFMERDLHDMVDILVDRWCHGYMKGIQLRSELWKKNASELKEDIYPIMMFGTKSIRSLHDEFTKAQIDEWKSNIAQSARRIYAHWLKFRPPHEDTVRQPYIRESQKVGRNDLCSCGSGKKYKRCCGAH